MAWTDTLKALAPTVASALGGPLAGAAVAALGQVFGMSSPTVTSIASVIEQGQMTPGDIAKIKELELQYQNEERERDFRYAQLEFQDRDSARKANVSGGAQLYLFVLSMLLLSVCLGAECFVLFRGYPKDIPDIVVGRVLGLLDSVALMCLNYWYGTSSGSERKTELLAQAPAVEK